MISNLVWMCYEYWFLLRLRPKFPTDIAHILWHHFRTPITRRGALSYFSWLRHCATSLKVVGSISRWWHWLFHWHNPSGRAMALGSIQPLKSHVPIFLKPGRLNLLELSGSVQAFTGMVLPLLLRGNQCLSSATECNSLQHFLIPYSYVSCLEWFWLYHNNMHWI